jgi:4-hydroxy-tetrahydrodipicolinate synthase
MHANGDINFNDLEKLINWHVENGTNGIVAVGTTGESPSLNFIEHINVIKKTIEFVAGRIPVIAGTGANSTSEAIDLCKASEDAGAEFSLTVVPYYNKPTQSGLLKHFELIAHSSKLKHILYNVPSRTITDLADETTLKLAQIENIVGIKDATADMYRVTNLVKNKPKDFLLLSGDDASALPFLFLGGDGVISVTANVVPGHFSKMCKFIFEKKYEDALGINQKLLSLNSLLFIEANPIPVKWLLSRMNMLQSDYLRSPLTILSKSHEQLLLKAAAEANIF